MALFNATNITPATLSTHTTFATKVTLLTDPKGAVDSGELENDQSAYIEKLKLLASLVPSAFDHISDILGKFSRWLMGKNFVLWN